MFALDQRFRLDHAGFSCDQNISAFRQSVLVADWFVELAGGLPLDVDGQQGTEVDEDEIAALYLIERCVATSVLM